MFSVLLYIFKKQNSLIYLLNFNINGNFISIEIINSSSFEGFSFLETLFVSFGAFICSKESINSLSILKSIIILLFLLYL